MVLFRLIAFALAAFALAGCCASVTGCPAALPADLAVWDGRATTQDDGTLPEQQPTPSTKRPKAKVTTTPFKQAGEYAKPNSDQYWAEKEAAERDADAKLAQQLKICRGCSSPGRDDDATGNAAR
jgi:hypothetical protein